MTPRHETDTWEPGNPYERYVGRWSRRVAPEFLAWAGVPAGNATALPFSDAAVDAVVSGLMLNFVADQPAALREMARVARDGGTIAAYVWDYAGAMELMRYFWDAAAELDPEASRLDEGVRFPSCDPQALEALFAAAGLDGVAVRAIDIETLFDDFADYWEPFLGGQGPAPAYAMSLDEGARERLRKRIRARLPAAPDGSIPLRARAGAVRGTRQAGAGTMPRR